MIVINTVDTKTFSINGINYTKNFLSKVSGNYLSVYNAYENCDERVPLTLFSDFIVDGITYLTVALLQEALLPITFNQFSQVASDIVTGYANDLTVNYSLSVQVPTKLTVLAVNLNNAPIGVEWVKSGTTLSIPSSRDGDIATVSGIIIN